MTEIRLDIGGGEFKRCGHINVDLQLQYADIVCDLTQRLPFKHNIADSIWCCMVLEHLKQNKWMGCDDAHKLMHEMYRTLKPGGFAEIIVPDFGTIAEDYSAGVLVDKADIRSYLMGAQYNRFQEHHSLWSEAWLRDAFEEAGFKKIKRIMYSGEGHQQKKKYNLQMIGYK